jgi:hypothetical protein
MSKLDALVADYLADRLLKPDRLEKILAIPLDRRQERTARRKEHLDDLNRRATESEARLKRLYDAIEQGITDLDDPSLKDRIAGLKAVRGAGSIITPAMLMRFASVARSRMRLEGGEYRREHLRALAQRVEVADGLVRIMGSKTNLLRTLIAAEGVNPAVPGVRSSVLNWRTGWLCHSLVMPTVYTVKPSSAPLL